MEKDNRSILQKGKHIVGSMVNDLPLGEEWFEKRMEICNACEFNSKNANEDSLTGMSRLRLKDTLAKRLLMPNYLKKDFCTECTCPIENKCSVKFETCGLADSGKPPKWLAIEKYMDMDGSFSIENLTPDMGTIGTNLKGFTYTVEKDDTHGLKISFSFRIKRKVPFKIIRLEASCGCTVPNFQLENSKNTVVNVDFSTRDLGTGVHKKSITIFFTDSDQTATKTFPVTIQYIVKNVGEL